MFRQVKENCMLDIDYNNALFLLAINQKRGINAIQIVTLSIDYNIAELIQNIKKIWNDFHDTYHDLDQAAVSFYLFSSVRQATGHVS